MEEPDTVRCLLRRTREGDTGRVESFRKEHMKQGGWYFGGERELASIRNGLHFVAEAGEVESTASRQTEPAILGVLAVVESDLGVYEIVNVLVHQAHTGKGLFTALTRVAAHALRRVAGADDRLFIAFRKDNGRLKTSFEARGFTHQLPSKCPSSLFEDCKACPERSSCEAFVDDSSDSVSSQQTDGSQHPSGCCCDFLELPRKQWDLSAPSQGTKRRHLSITYEPSLDPQNTSPRRPSMSCL
ncbi:hypothetical protein DIPPA_65875 [Diplonema papillatum]|nr:hypothetical protein DIPPA_65875 [Diplonema papillatum]